MFSIAAYRVWWCTCADPGIFVRGGPGQADKKKLWHRFFFFKSLAYFTEVKWSISKKSITFQGSRGGPTFSRGVQLFPGGVQLLIPYRNPYNLWFSRGGPDPLSPPLDPHLLHVPNPIPNKIYYVVNWKAGIINIASYFNSSSIQIDCWLHIKWVCDKNLWQDFVILGKLQVAAFTKKLSLVWKDLQKSPPLIIAFVWFDSLRPINNLSVIKGQVSWVEPVLS